MSSFSQSDSSFVCPLPPSPRPFPRSDIGQGSRSRVPYSETRTSHVFRHPQAYANPRAGSRDRHLDWHQEEYLPSSSKTHELPARNTDGDYSSIPQTPSPISKVRRYSAASSTYNEVSPLRARAFPHAHARGTTSSPRLRFTQVLPVSSTEPPSLSSSLTSPAPSLTTPPTPQSQRSSPRHPKRTAGAFVTPSASIASVRSDTRPCEQRYPQCERYTPSPSPLSHASRELRPISHRSSPLASPRTLSIKRGLIPLRARPTLAMSMQVHAPTPVLSTQPMSPPLPLSMRSRSRSRARSSSRPSSPLTSSVPLPQRPPMPRPPSRSERLLRDTLRRAEEQERSMNPTSSLFGLSPPLPNSNLPAQLFGPARLPAAAHGGRRHRRNTSSSVQSDSSCDYFDGEALDEESPEDEEDNEWHWRGDGAASSSSNSSGHGHPPTRAISYGREDINPPAPISPARAQLQRAAKSSPAVPRRNSLSQSLTHPTSRVGVDAEHSMTPHEAVLRSRLEGVLKNAKVQDRRPRSVERQDPESGFSSGSGNSMASSRNISGEGDFFFGAIRDSKLTSLKPNEARHKLVASATSSPHRDQRHVYMAPSTSPRSAHKHLSSQKGSSSGSSSPLTPPPSPPFNARVAAAQCRSMDGYISFANIEGLGMPDGSDEETDEDAKSRSRWFQWLHLSGKTAVHDRTRGRSESTSSASR